MPIHNYREIPITLNGQRIMIGGFGHAFKEGTFQSLRNEHNVGAVISLADNYEHEFDSAGMDSKYYTHLEVDDWVETPFKQAERIEPSVYDNLYNAVEFAQKAGLKTAIHCGEGRGRTGTAIATLKLRELLEAEYNANPALIEAEQVKSKRLDVVDFDERRGKINCHVVVTPLVKAAVEHVRSFDNPGNTSVETLNDVETLLLYERHFRARFALRKNHADVVKTFFESKDSNQDINLALKEAVNNGYAHVVEALIESRHPDLNIDDEEMYEGELRKPLYIAAVKGHAKVVKVLLDVSADEDINEALQDVITKEGLNEDVKVNVVKAFLDSHYPDLNINKALELVIKRCNTIKLINTFLESNYPDLDIQKAREIAVKYGNEKIIKEYIDKMNANVLPVIMHTQTPGTLFLSKNRAHSVPARPKPATISRRHSF